MEQINPDIIPDEKIPLDHPDPGFDYDDDYDEDDD